MSHRLLTTLHAAHANCVVVLLQVILKILTSLVGRDHQVESFANFNRETEQPSYQCCITYLQLLIQPWLHQIEMGWWLQLTTATRLSRPLTVTTLDIYHILPYIAHCMLIFFRESKISIYISLIIESEMIPSTVLILGLRPANERRRYKITPYLIGWVQT